MSKSNYDKLYLHILEIGQSKAESGMSYNELKEELTNLGYDFENDCIELAVKQWYFHSFSHFACHEPYATCEDLDNHQDCHCILNGDACLRLLEYKTSKNELRIARIALWISVAGIFLTIVLSLI